MVSILTADGEIHEDEETLRRKFQLFVDVAGDIIRGTGEVETWLGLDTDAVRDKNLTHLVEPQSLFLTSEIIYHAASGERMKTCSVFLFGPDRSVNGFMVRGEPMPEQDEYKLYFTQDPDMALENGGKDSAKGLAQTVSHYLTEDPDANLDMTFVDIGDVDSLSDDPSLSNNQVDEFTKQVEERLREESIAPDAVSRVDNGKYGIVHESGADLGNMQGDLKSLTEKVDPNGARLEVATKTIELDAEGLDEEAILTAVEHAADEFVDQGLDAIIFDTLADSQVAYLDKRANRTELLVQALDEGLLTVAYSSVVDTHIWKTDHLMADFRADLEDDGLGSTEILSLTAQDMDLRARVDEAQVDFILECKWQDGISVAVGLDIHSLTRPGLLGKLLTFAEKAGNRHVVLRIEGLSPELIERIDALQILRKAGFAVALFGGEIGALNDDSLRELPADFIIMDEHFTASPQSLKSSLQALTAMGQRCQGYGKALMFEGIVSGEIAQLLSKIPGVLAAGPYFGKAIHAFSEMRYPMKSRQTT